jgi:O-antigen/teichoic acid export membrane protein
MTAEIPVHEVETSLRRGAAWAVSSQIVSQAIRIVGVVVLARLLSKQDYGSAGLAVTVASYSVMLGDLGYGTALVQRPKISQHSASTAFWAAIAAGGICFVITALAAYPAARILGTPEITWLVIAGGSTLFLVALGSASNALLTRRMRFGAIQAIGVIALVTATACSTTSAVLAAGPWALVTQQVVLAGMTSMLFILVAKWRPSLQFSLTQFRSMSRFSMPFTGGSVLFAFQSLVTALLVGRLVGIEALGIWTFSMAIVIAPLMLIAAPVARVIYAGFARMRDHTDRVAEIWLSGVTLLAAVILPALFGLIGVAPDFIPYVFGAQWEPAVPIVQILCLLLMLRSLQTWNSSVMDAAGKPHVSMALNGAVLVLLLPCIWIGSEFGLEGVAASYVVATLLAGEIPSFVITTRELSISVGSILHRLKGIVVASALMLVVVVATRILLERAGVGIETRIVTSIVIGALIYVALLSVLARSVAARLLQIGVMASPLRSRHST